jgi:hypothetical protein
MDNIRSAAARVQQLHLHHDQAVLSCCSSCHSSRTKPDQTALTGDWQCRQNARPGTSTSIESRGHQVHTRTH